jgi:hypothetical protein
MQKEEPFIEEVSGNLFEEKNWISIIIYISYAPKLLKLNI